MKINRLDAHDRLLHLKKQGFDIAECCQNLIDQKPFGDHAFYIFAHARTLGMDERFKLFSSGVYKTFEEVPSTKIIWQPRLTKPTAEPNSMLFKAYPGSDILKTIWIIPKQELWAQYKKGNVTENQTVVDSIIAYKTNRLALEAPEQDDLSEEQIDYVYKQISFNSKYKRVM